MTKYTFKVVREYDLEAVNEEEAMDVGWMLFQEDHEPPKIELFVVAEK